MTETNGSFQQNMIHWCYNCYCFSSVVILANALPYYNVPFYHHHRCMTAVTQGWITFKYAHRYSCIYHSFHMMVLSWKDFIETLSCLIHSTATTTMQVFHHATWLKPFLIHVVMLKQAPKSPTGWLMRMVFLGVIHHAFFFLPANDRCNNEQSVPVVIVIVTAVIIWDDVDGHGSIQTQNTFRGKVHELTCTHTSTTSLETITHISRPWHLQVQTRALDILARVKKLTIMTVLHNTAVFILDLKGKVLISRNYRGDIPMSAVEKFMPLVCLFKRDDNKD